MITGLNGTNSAIYCKYKERYVEKTPPEIITWEGEVKVKRRNYVDSSFCPKANTVPFLLSIPLDFCTCLLRDVWI